MIPTHIQPSSSSAMAPTTHRTPSSSDRVGMLHINGQFLSSASASSDGDDSGGSGVLA